MTYMTSVIENISKLQFELSPSRNTDLISAVLTKSPNLFFGFDVFYLVLVVKIVYFFVYF